MKQLEKLKQMSSEGKAPPKSFDDLYSNKTEDKSHLEAIFEDTDENAETFYHQDDNEDVETSKRHINSSNTKVSTKKRVLKQVKTSNIIDAYKSDEASIEKPVRKTVYISQLHSQKLDKLVSMYNLKKSGNDRIDISTLVRNALDEYLDKTYKKFKAIEDPNPFE